MPHPSGLRVRMLTLGVCFPPLKQNQFVSSPGGWLKGRLVERFWVPHPCGFCKGADFDFSIEHPREMPHLLVQVVDLDPIPKAFAAASAS